ncbi:MAG: hypothetical protein ACQERZ_05350 [Fusobacteriota bacterium]
MIFNVRIRKEILIRGSISNDKRGENFNNKAPSEDIDLEKRTQIMAEEDLKEYKIC